jgi:hypothetical protein
VRRSLLLLALLSTASLSGCAGRDAPSGEGSADVPVVTDPLDYSYLQNATAGSHIHDYWQGRDRITVIESESGSFGASCSGGCSEGMLFSTRVPDDGIIVPQGTRWVNGTIGLAANGENTWTRLELWIRTAEDAEARPWGNITPGTPFSFESTNEQDDPPHYVLSLWEFGLRAYGAGDEVRVAGKLSWKIEAVRGLPLVAYPPHPDQWNGATELDLLEDTQASQYTLYREDPTGSTSTFCSGGCPGTHRLGDGVVVPFDAATVEVRLSYGPGMPAGLGVSFHGSDTRSLTKLTGTTESPGVTLFTIAVEPGVADSPYAKQSLWEFDVWLDYPQDPPVQAWSGEYTLAVTALKG